MATYHRTKDGQQVTEEEACDGYGHLLDGYTIRTKINLMDAVNYASADELAKVINEDDLAQQIFDNVNDHTNWKDKAIARERKRLSSAWKNPPPEMSDMSVHDQLVRDFITETGKIKDPYQKYDTRIEQAWRWPPHTNQEHPMSYTSLTRAASSRFQDMSDGVEEAQNRVLALQRKCSEIERQLSNTEDPKHIAEYQADLERQRARMQQAQHTFVDLSRVLAAVRMWVNSLSPGIQFEDVDASLGITCCTDGDYQTTINTLRLEIGDLTRDRHRVQHAQPPLNCLTFQIEQHVDALAARGEPKILVENDKLNIKYESTGIPA